MPAGRPTKYKPEYAVQAAKICAQFGATDEKLAEFFEVDVTTISEWKKVHEAFSQALTEGKATPDDEVEASLYKRATGYTRKIQKLDKNGHPTFCEEELPPDPTSMIFWLKNRRRDRWRDRQDLEHSGEVKFSPVLEILPAKKAG